MPAVRRPIAALFLATTLLVSSGCSDTSQAADINGTEISHDELADELAAWSESDELLTQLQITDAGGDGRYSQALVREVLNLRIQAERAREGLAATPDAPEVTDEDIATVESQFGALFSSFPSEISERVFADIAALQVASQVLTELPPVDVEVNPRYGSYDSANLVTAPLGPLPGPVADVAPQP